MPNDFFEQPIINSPYEYPNQHWELDESGRRRRNVIKRRRLAEFITPIPRPGAAQGRMAFDESGLSTDEQQYDVTATVNEIRRRVDQWRQIPNPSSWGVTPETARLLTHRRHHEFNHYRPFFCQVEAVETVIWLTEVAPGLAPTFALCSNAWKT